MNRSFAMLAAAVALLGCASPAISQGGPVEARAARSPGAGPEARSLSARPFARLFGAQTPPVRVPFRLGTPARTPSRTTPLPTCGLIVVPPDSRIDPSFERRPADDGTRFSMRTMPWLCK